MTAKVVMVLGTTSGAGKSWLATALCRWYARAGFKVSPFKAQNMSNNARVVPGLEGQAGEIGSAQYFQALAARTMPHVRMNPVLLKPERDMASQVVLMGQVRAELAKIPWHTRSSSLWPHARAALDVLMSENDVVVIEGAGSPAEINLRGSDYVNMRTAVHANAACLLVADINRGGAFAHLYGTHQLLPTSERALIRGFVLNQFRGDATLLSPGPQQLQSLTGVPTVAVLPLWRGHGLPEEDSIHHEWLGAPVGDKVQCKVALVKYPHISNLDEFQALRNLPGVALRCVSTPAETLDTDWIILPGSKNTIADLQWLRQQGLERVITHHAKQGRPVLGICGGLQMLGISLNDSKGIESGNCSSPSDASVDGLGLLPLHTNWFEKKCLSTSTVQFGATAKPWINLSHQTWSGYEIHQGRTHASFGAEAVLFNDKKEAIGWQNGSVMGIYAHGMLESPATIRALFGDATPTLDDIFNGLADFIDHHFEPGVLGNLLTA